MNNVIYLFLLVTLSNVCYSSSSSNDAVKVRHTRSLIMDYNWPEPDPSIKKYPHERNCHYYYQAEGNDIFTIRKCHEGEIFDYHKHECTQKRNGQCFSDRYGPTKIHEHIHSKFRKLFKCPSSNGNFPDIFDCRKYFHCTNGKPKHRQCHSNKHFDKLRRHCVDRKNALCADITDVADDIQKDYKCPRPHGLFADPKVCSKYYECLHRKPTLKICQTGQLFDVTKKRCNFKEEVDCGSKFNPYENTEFVLSSTQSSTMNEAETSTKTSSLLEETHPKKETVVTTTVNELLNTTSEVFLNISTSSLSNQPEKTATSEPQHESTEADSKKNTAFGLSSTHRSTLSETETSTENSSSFEETHSTKETVKTTVTVNELSSTVSNISGSIPSSSLSSQPEKSATSNPEHESTETDSKKNTEFVLSSTQSSTMNEAETSTKTSSLLEETHPKKETVVTTTVNELLNTTSEVFLNISTSSLSNQPEKTATSEPQHESTEADSKKNTAFGLSSTHRSTLSETETSTENSSSFEETHSTKETVKTTVTVNELSSTVSNISGSIPSSSLSSQPEKSATSNPEHESTETDSKSKSTSVSSKGRHSTEYEALTKTALLESSNILPCPPETCIQDGDVQLRCATANGVYPYKKDKSRFILCDNFKLYIRPCPHHQVFDEKQNACILILSIAKTVTRLFILQ